jgi:transcription elongation factor Elf1
MQALDGNAIAGDLFEIFGTEMTAVRGTCTHCGTTGLVAELVVYIRAPGHVARCRNCGNVVMVLVSLRGSTTVDHRSFRLLDAP